MSFKNLLLIFLMIIGISQVSYATTIDYSVNDLGAGVWEYNYTVSNDTLASNIDEFTIYFTYGMYDNLNVTTPVADWDELTVNPQLILGIPEDGFYDALALVSGIAPGDTASGFSVSFDWLGSDIPGSQSFEIVDPSNFNVIDSGSTTANANPIPEPGTLMLLCSGLAGLFAFRLSFRT